MLVKKIKKITISISKRRLFFYTKLTIKNQLKHNSLPTLLKSFSFFKKISFKVNLNYLLCVLVKHIFLYFFKSFYISYKSLFLTNIALPIILIYNKSIGVSKKIFKSLYKLFLIHVFISFFFKKTWLLLKFIQRNFWDSKSDKIRQLIYNLRSFFKKFHLFLTSNFFINGFIFFFKGKIGVYGNSRKKKQILKYGLLNSTNTHINISQTKAQFINKSGLTNCYFILLF